MKICITKASDDSYLRIHEYQHLEDCVNEMLEEEFKMFSADPSVIVSRPNPEMLPKFALDCDYEVMLFDDCIQ